MISVRCPNRRISLQTGGSLTIEPRSNPDLARALLYILLTMKKFLRLFTIKTKLEVFMVTYALGLGAVKRGEEYMIQYPGNIGKVFFLLCTAAVFIAGAKMLEAVELDTAFGAD